MYVINKVLHLYILQQTLKSLCFSMSSLTGANKDIKLFLYYVTIQEEEKRTNKLILN